MGIFEGLCHNPTKSKMAGSNWLQTDEAVDVTRCDLHVKKGFCSNPRSVKVEARRKKRRSLFGRRTEKKKKKSDLDYWLPRLVLLSPLPLLKCTVLSCSLNEKKELILFFLKQGGSALCISCPLLCVLLYWAQLEIGWSPFFFFCARGSCAVLGEVGPQMAVYCCK